MNYEIIILFISHLWLHVEPVILAVLVNLLLFDHLTQMIKVVQMENYQEGTHVADELEVCIVPTGAKHCCVVHLKKKQVESQVYGQERRESWLFLVLKYLQDSVQVREPGKT